MEKFTKQEVDPPISHLNFLFFSIFLDWGEWDRILINITTTTQSIKYTPQMNSIKKTQCIRKGRLRRSGTKAHYWAHSTTSTRIVQRSQEKRLSVKKTPMLPYWTKHLKKKTKVAWNDGILSNSKKEYCMHDEHHFLHILTEATTELSDSIPILLLVVPSPPSCCQPPLLKYLIHSRSLAMSLRMRIRRVTISVTSLTLKWKLFQKEIVWILQEKNKNSYLHTHTHK